MNLCSALDKVSSALYGYLMTTTETHTSLPAGYATKALATGLKVWHKESGAGHILKASKGEDETTAGAIHWAWWREDMIAEGNAYWAAQSAK